MRKTQDRERTETHLALQVIFRCDGRYPLIHRFIGNVKAAQRYSPKEPVRGRKRPVAGSVPTTGFISPRLPKAAGVC
jgi:hypothetical protein